MALGPIAMGIISTVIMAAILIFLGALLLMASTKIFKLKDTSYLTALKVNAILFVGYFIFMLIGSLHIILLVIMMLLVFLLMILGAMYLIKRMYKINWGKAALTWLIWGIFVFVLLIILSALSFFMAFLSVPFFTSMM